jgi:hypothetical protein
VAELGFPRHVELPELCKVLHIEKIRLTLRARIRLIPQSLF